MRMVAAELVAVDEPAVALVAVEKGVEKVPDRCLHSHREAA